MQYIHHVMAYFLESSSISVPGPVDVPGPVPDPVPDAVLDPALAPGPVDVPDPDAVPDPVLDPVPDPDPVSDPVPGPSPGPDPDPGPHVVQHPWPAASTESTIRWEKIKAQLIDIGYSNYALLDLDIDTLVHQLQAALGFSDNSHEAWRLRLERWRLEDYVVSLWLQARREFEPTVLRSPNLQRPPVILELEPEQSADAHHGVARAGASAEALLSFYPGDLSDQVASTLALFMDAIEERPDLWPSSLIQTTVEDALGVARGGLDVKRPLFKDVVYAVCQGSHERRVKVWREIDEANTCMRVELAGSDRSCTVTPLPGEVWREVEDANMLIELAGSDHSCTPLPGEFGLALRDSPRSPLAWSYVDDVEHLSACSAVNCANERVGRRELGEGSPSRALCDPKFTSDKP